jgi:hypothetical protein
VTYLHLFAEELKSKDIEPYVHRIPPSRYTRYNLASVALEARIRNNDLQIFVESNEMNKKPGFWGERKPIYQQISQAKYERIVQGRGHRAMVETNAYFRVTRGINRLNGTAISCYVLFNRAYWFNPVDSKHYSIQLNGYVMGAVDGFSISSAYYASHRNSRNWEMIELEWLVEGCKVSYQELDLYSIPALMPEQVFAKKMGPEANPPANLDLIRQLFDTTTGKLFETNPNLLRDETV